MKTHTHTHNLTRLPISAVIPGVHVCLLIALRILFKVDAAIGNDKIRIWLTTKSKGPSHRVKIWIFSFLFFSPDLICKLIILPNSFRFLAKNSIIWNLGIFSINSCCFRKLEMGDMMNICYRLRHFFYYFSGYMSDFSRLFSWRHHDMEMLTTLLTLCEGNPPYLPVGSVRCGDLMFSL